MGKVMKSKAMSKLLTQKRKGHVAKRAERGAGLKFKVETFATVSKFKPGTRIKYGPNPKRPDSKSYTRYAGYQNSKTVGESLKNGAKVADFLWELERGDYKILGTERPEKQEIAAIGKAAFDRCVKAFSSFQGPNGLAVNLDDPRAAEVLKREEEWRKTKTKRCEVYAKELKLHVETNEEIEASGENSADIRLQRRVADALAAKKLKSGKKITDSDLDEVLHCWGFCENSGRLNVLPPGVKYVYSDTIGAIRRRTGGFGLTPATMKYPNFTTILNQWLADNDPKLGCKFKCTAINLNANYAAARHRDGNNEGPSIIRAFGKFKGGKLLYYPKDSLQKPRAKVESLNKKDAVAYDLAKNTTVFDGNKAHEVEPFTGERYSIVFFTARGYNKVKSQNVNQLKKLGFPWPTAPELAKLKKHTLK